MLSKAEVVMLGITGTGPPEVVRQAAIDWKEMHDKLEAQLAAEASAVEELKQAYIVARAVKHQSDPYDKGRQSGYVIGLQAALDIVTGKRAASLTEAEGK